MDFHVRVDHVGDNNQVPEGDVNLLARFNVPVSLDPTNVSSLFQIYPDIRAQGPYLRVGFQLNCTGGYFGPNCTNVCYPRDDEQGHYTCDREGNIVCMSGFQNVLTNCTECALSPGCCESALHTVEPLYNLIRDYKSERSVFFSEVDFLFCYGKIQNSRKEGGRRFFTQTKPIQLP